MFNFKSVQPLIEAMAVRANELAKLPIDDLRASYPITTETRAELVRLVKESHMPRGEMIEDILIDEFTPEYDINLEPYG